MKIKGECEMCGAPAVTVWDEEDHGLSMTDAALRRMAGYSTRWLICAARTTGKVCSRRRLNE